MASTTNFIIVANAVATSGNVVTTKPNATTFYNAGNKTLKINKILPVLPGGNLIIEGNFGEFDNTNYTVTFDPTDTQPELIYIQKIYT